MKITVFETPGEFDLRALDTMGMTAKPKSNNPIGRFGSGLKYAISILLREGAKIDLYCNGDHYSFFTDKDEDFRGSKFDRICYTKTNSLLGWFTPKTKLPYTTHFGEHWELWQAFRELYANTLDENGACYVDALEDLGVTMSAIGKSKDKTYIVVEHIEFAKLYPRRGEIFLDPSRETVAEVEGVGNVTPKKSQHLYFRGMRAFDLPEDQPAQFTYNVIEEVELTEDRTIKSEYDYRDKVKKVIIESDNKEFIRAVLTAPEKSFEHQQLDFSYEYGASKAFKEVAKEVHGKEGANRSVATYVSRYVSPPKPQKCTDEQWNMIKSALVIGSRYAYEAPSGRPLNVVDDDEAIRELYEKAFKEVFDR